MIEFDCPLCGRHLSVAPEFEGQTGTCKHCGGTITASPNARVAPPPIPGRVDSATVIAKPNWWLLPVQIAALFLAPLGGYILFFLPFQSNAVALLGALFAETLVVYRLVSNLMGHKGRHGYLAVIGVSVMASVGMLVVVIGVIIMGCTMLLMGIGG